MTTVATRKKSIVGANGIPSIDIPQQNNTLLNKAASQSTSLYQQCSQLRSRLMSIRDFHPFLELPIPQDDIRKSTDMVHDLWNRLQLGVPLVFLFNLLPPPAMRIGNINTDPNSIDLSLMASKDHTVRKSKQRPIAQVIMAIARLQKEGSWSPDLNFTVGDLLESDTNGFVKVVQTLSYLVERLPADVFVESSTLSLPPPSNNSQASFQSQHSGESVIPEEVERKNIIREMLETERKYVQDLEVMQARLLKLLDFQRKFLISMEQIAEIPWKEQTWGKLFTDNEDEFQVYEPYCANYTNATEVLLAEEQNLMSLSEVINPKSELPAFLIKPVQRICKYPLLLDQLVKKSSSTEYPLYDDLVEGSAAAKRVADKINEAQRRAENLQTVQTLQSRVEDWKGHHLSNFGDLLLDDIFLVTKSEVDREYHVFLFEKIILCCKEAVVVPSKKVAKNNSLLKKQSIHSTVPGGSGLSKKKNTPLLLKGRIFLNNVTSARRVPVPGDPHTLRVFWRGEDDTEYFTLRCRTEEQLKQWETAINRLIEVVNARRNSERLPAAQYFQRMKALKQEREQRALQVQHERTSSVNLQSPGTTGIPASRYPSSYRTEPWQNGNEGRGSHQPALSASTPGSIHPQSTYSFIDEHYGGEVDYFEYGQGKGSGRGTPSGTRRPGDYMSMPPEQRDNAQSYERPRAKTEEPSGQTLQSWRSQSSTGSSPAPLPPGAMPARTPMASTRINSDVNVGSNGVPPVMRPGLRSKFSSTRLRDDEEQQQTSSFSRTGSQTSITGTSGTRARSTSNPSQYTNSKANPPPLPTGHWNGGKTSDRNRGSGSSQSTGESSDYSPPHTGSPITSFGSVESSNGISTHSNGLRSTRSQAFGGSRKHVFIKVRYGEDLFTLDLSRSIQYEDLVASVGHKVRRCGPRRTNAPLRIKYEDEDGDLVNLSTTEDLQIAFDMAGGATLTLYVQ
ncbi:hypothetical protein Clacol_000705 [Clathrus columnatus]|uniref:Rho guanine nucleotide exchange factor scd1 n=1 Tax=Clathrus columnatus TaxID=1419009 RepID=A0AAV4ZZ64_9AGAM|nr:hypothetical protein Clacol_000705 [Clathrus columnatus]